MGLLKNKAATPQKALAKARSADRATLNFQPYDGWHRMNCITILDANNSTLAVWRNDDLCLRFAAPALLEAAEKVVSHMGKR